MGDIIIQAVIFPLLSSIYIAAGLRVLLAKRPFIVSQLWEAIIGFAPLTAVLLTTLWPGFQAQSWLLVFLAVGCMTILWGIALCSFRGGIVIGTTGTALRDALRHALRRLSLSYEESAQAFRLPTLKNELAVEATLFDGMFVLRPKKFGVRSAIRQLTPKINEFFRTAPAQTNKRLGYGFIVIGAVILLFGSWLIYLTIGIKG